MLCERCRILAGAASSTEPHAWLYRIALQRYCTIEKNKANGVDIYRCTHCSTPWVRHITASAYSLPVWQARVDASVNERPRTGELPMSYDRHSRYRGSDVNVRWTKIKPAGFTAGYMVTSEAGEQRHWYFPDLPFATSDTAVAYALKKTQQLINAQLLG